MFTLFERSDEFNQLNAETVRLANVLRNRLADLGVKCSFEAGDSVIVRGSANQNGMAESIFYLESGFLSADSKEGTLYFIEEGQFIGFGLVNGGSVRFTARSEVNGLQVSWDKVIPALQTDSELCANIFHYVQSQSALLQLFLSRLSPSEVSSLPKVQSFGKGEAIIIQETTPHEVFTLLHGKASAYLQDVRVGDINQGDIFGAMAASENSGRSASVIADTFCVVSVVSKNEFFELVKTHPNTMHQLVSTMSSIIVSQNEKLLKYGRE